jgi:hypothetical protein
MFVAKRYPCLTQNWLMMANILSVKRGINMPENVQFHFLLLAAGEVLKRDRFVNAQKIQDFIVQDKAFGVRIPLDECRLALTLLEDSGFIMKANDDEDKYERTTFLMVMDKWK